MRGRVPLDIVVLGAITPVCWILLSPQIQKLQIAFKKKYNSSFAVKTMRHEVRI